VKLIVALNGAGIEMIDEGAISQSGGRGVRLRPHKGASKPTSDSRPSVGSRART
jgi:hypothetical protein